MAHASEGSLQALPATALADIDLVFGGHRHRQALSSLHGVPLVESGQLWRTYTQVTGAWSPGEAQVTWDIVGLSTTARETVVAWTEALGTTEAAPLDDHFDDEPRRLASVATPTR